MMYDKISFQIIFWNKSQVFKYENIDHVIVVHILIWDKRMSQINEYSHRYVCVHARGFSLKNTPSKLLKGLVDDLTLTSI